MPYKIPMHIVVPRCVSITFKATETPTFTRGIMVIYNVTFLKGEKKAALFLAQVVQQHAVIMSVLIISLFSPNA
jgi:hypothetical protein